MVRPPARQSHERGVPIHRVQKLVNGAAGVVATRKGVVFTIASVIVRNGKIAELDFLADPERLARLDLTILDDRD